MEHELLEHIEHSEHVEDIEHLEQSVGWRSVQISLLLALGSALVFYGLAGLLGGAMAALRVSGAAGVGVLTLIAAVPVVISRLKQDDGTPAG